MSSHWMQNKSDQAAESHVPLISGLPDDLALLCLARIPRRFHHILRCVSRRWRALLCTEEWHSCRQKNNLEETWIYVFCRGSSRGNFCYVLDPDPARRSWKRLQDIPPQCLKKEGMSFEALGKKLYLLGGCSWHEDATDEVYCYDPSAEKWEAAAKMPTARCYFVSGALDDKLYVTCGLGLSSGCLADLESWDIYDSRSNSWSSHSDPMCCNIVKTSAFNKKIFAIHKSCYHSYHAGLYDLESRKWEALKNETLSGVCGPMVVVDGTIFMLDESLGTRLMMWQKESNLWVPFGRLSEKLTRPPCQLAAVGRTIYVIGKGLSVVVVDIDKAAKVGGMMVSSSYAPKINDDLFVTSCSTIAI